MSDTNGVDTNGDEEEIDLSSLNDDDLCAQMHDDLYDGLGDDDTAMLSKRRADRLRAWERMAEMHNEGDEVHGIVQRKKFLILATQTAQRNHSAVETMIKPRHAEQKIIGIKVCRHIIN